MKLELLSEAAPEAGPAASFLQSSFWGDFKSSFGWKAHRFQLRLRLESEGTESRDFSLLALERRLAGPLGFAYVPGGPALDLEPQEGSLLLAELARLLKSRLSPGCLFLRFDPPWYEAEGLPPETGTGPAEPGTDPAPASEEGEGAGEKPIAYPEPRRPRLAAPLRKAASDVQPPDSVLLDLLPSEAELLAAMKPKWRYNIRLAEKKGVVVAEEGSGALPIFYRLYEETARRDRIALHPETYYARLFELADAWRAEGAGEGPAAAPARAGGEVATRPDLRLWVARHEGEALAAIVTLFRGERATYLYGASSDHKRNLMPAYALQWAAIRAAKAAGCEVYDFYGLPPSADPSHPMAGLYRFKTGFGGRLVHYAGSWDYPLLPLVYAGFRAAESLRSFYFKRFRKLGRG